MGGLEKRTLGFLGTGAITEAVVTGLNKTRFASNSIVLSPRSAAISSKLAAAHDNVEIADGNQDVLDRADIVFIAVRPQIIEEVLLGLQFKPEHHVVSFVAATPLDRLAAWIGKPVQLSQAIPLPFVANLQGATAIHPPDPVSTAIFSALGTAVEVTSKKDYDLLAAASALMGTYFGILEATSTWLEEQGLPSAAGDAYLRQMFSGLDLATRLNPGVTFSTLAREHSTPGGLNEQVLQDFNSAGGTEALNRALAGVLARIAR